MQNTKWNLWNLISCITNTKFSVYLLSFCFASCLIYLGLLSIHYPYSAWQISEWLPNYSDGFMRRGLPGTIIYFFVSNWQIQTRTLILIISYASFAFVGLFLITQNRKCFPKVVFLSPLFLGCAVYAISFQGEYIARKDFFLLAVLISCLYATKLSNQLRFITFNLLAIAAILSHEVFIFIAVPALSVFVYLHNLGTINSNRHGLINTIFFIWPTWAASLLIPFFHGTPSAPGSIAESWNQLWLKFEAANCCIEVNQGNALGYLSLHLSDQLDSILKDQILNVSAGIYVPFAWAATILLSGYFLINMLQVTNEGGDICIKRNQMSCILLFQLTCILPLFALGTDYGRWINLWIISSFILYKFNFFPENIKLPKVYPRLLEKVIGWKFKPRLGYLLFFSIPPYTWSLNSYLECTPLGSLFIIFRSSLEYLYW